MKTRCTVELDKINAGFPGPVAENSFDREGKRSDSKLGPQGSGGPHFYEVAPAKKILHEFDCPETGVTARRMTDFVSEFSRAG